MMRERSTQQQIIMSNQIITLSFEVSEDRCIKAVSIMFNGTDMPNNHETVEALCSTVVHGIQSSSKSDLYIADELNDIGITGFKLDNKERDGNKEDS